MTKDEERLNKMLQETIGEEDFSGVACDLLESGELQLVVHAHWIEYMDLDFEGCYSGSSYSCSNCNEANYYDDVKDFKYCPYCGAKMDEKEG